ncbi:MAG: hypothetical protein IJ617_07695 [Oscillospiraceae bacterium]|nr:hypothetical protein [Oscillospiraceae bacterium]
MSIAEELDALIGRSGAVSAREMSRSGLTLAKVTNIKDEENLNRVKCLPISAKDEEETDWCYVMAPMGGKDCGVMFFPQVDDLVVLAYLDDDPHRPLVLGAYWNSETTAPLSVKDGKAEDYVLRTPKKIEILLHDKDKEQAVTLTMPSGTEIKIDDKEQSISIKDKGGDNALTMDLKGGNVTLKAKTKLTLSAGSTTITLESSGNLTEKADSKIAAQAANIETKATAKLAMQGAQAELKASATLDLNGSGMANLKGGLVKIN